LITGGVAQLGERSVRNAEAVGSTPIASTLVNRFSRAGSISPLVDALNSNCKKPMPRHEYHEQWNDWEADDSSDEVDEWDDETSEDDPQIVPCVHCGEEVLEDAEKCHRCGEYLTDSELNNPRKPLWFVITVLICLVIVYFWTVGI
jgi:predicted nucleic acid-binding Zn ribbon protein